MKLLLAFVLFSVFVIFNTFASYLAVMALMRNKGDVKGFAKVLAAFVIVPGALFDVTLNVISSAWFLDPPREWFFTRRMKRYLNAGPQWFGALDEWRWKMAARICRKYLNPFDPRGRHC